MACGVVYAAVRRFQVPLPENPPWWEAFDANKYEIDQVCRALAHLYSLPKPHYVPVSINTASSCSRSWDPPSQPVLKDVGLLIPNHVSNTASSAINIDVGVSKDMISISEESKNITSDITHPVEEKRLEDRDTERGRYKTQLFEDKGKELRHPKKLKRHHYSSKERDYGSSNCSSRERDRHIHYSYG